MSGAGGVDREAIVLRRAFAADRFDDMARLYVQDVGDLLAALAAAEREVEQMHRRWDSLIEAHAAARKRVEAAEQRADTAADLVGSMCHWRFDPHDMRAPGDQHDAFHFGDEPGQTGVCPYEAMAAVLRGKSDPRVAALSSRPVQPARCDTCEGAGAVRIGAQIGAPGSGGWITCPDCGPTPSETADEPQPDSEQR